MDPVELASSQVLEQEVRFIRSINRLLEQGRLIGGDSRFIEIHRIVMEHNLDDSSRFDRSAAFLNGLISYGRERAGQFLEKRAEQLSSRVGAGPRH